jgi:tRNA U34 5-methylaminomethyl-2-thiouridine-forming methyltransferase MnmC
MSLQPIRTDDGSITLLWEESNETYHSRRGALGESLHVYIQAGLYAAVQKFGRQITLLEVGFGTGLNALLTHQAAREKNLQIVYVALETNPISTELISSLNYAEVSGFPNDVSRFLEMHRIPFNNAQKIDDYLTLDKRSIDVKEFSDIHNRYHLIYYDAFGPRAQQELWTTAVFQRLYDVLLPDGMLVTYCSKTVVRRAMEEAGFTVEKLQGPWGKREIVRAFRKR